MSELPANMDHHQHHHHHQPHHHNVATTMSHERVKNVDNHVDNTFGDNNPPHTHHHSHFSIGLYGWRKRCLYGLIVILLIMVCINLALTLWVLKVMEFSSDGMGLLKIVTGGVRLEGKAFILDALIASSIKSRTGQPIVFESSRNLTIRSRDKNGRINSELFIGPEQFHCHAKSFKVLDDRGLPLMSIDKHEMLLNADNLKINGDGTSFSGSVQTTVVRSHSGHDLKLESPTRSMELRAPQGVHLESHGGNVKVVALNDIAIKSDTGSVRLDSASIVIPNLPTAIPTATKPDPNTNNNNNNNNKKLKHDIFQLCACNNGKLFLVPPYGHCASEENDRVCR